ncbi:hypothetical protein [Cylindrospermum stagnale]|uniref:hypothetical protein n=1 Tax=Cylindrospermum stagnale TaxID=142864 RepID=UPI00030E52AE|nr:hypothetical protein [Cylindrospermum stagnale]
MIWNQIYHLPSPSNNDACDYLLGRNLVSLVVAIACAVVASFIASRQQLSFIVTLANFAVKPFSV